MYQKLLKWDIYEISAEQSELNNVKLRGRIRKYGIENDLNILAENTQDIPGGVRIGVLEDTDIAGVEVFIRQIVPDSRIDLKMKGVYNPVLSKLKVNDTTRYEI